jgi:hypothetical protein
MSNERMLMELVDKRAVLAEKRARLQGIMESCNLLEGQLEMLNKFHQILSQDRRRKAGTSRVRPLWNPTTGELWYAGVLIKKLTKPAPNQRCLLDWFRRNQFKSPLPNPFLPGTNLNTAIDMCIHTVDGLNEDHVTKGVLRFGYANAGMKVNWQAVAKNLDLPHPG